MKEKHLPLLIAAPRNTTYELICHFARGNVPLAEISQVLSTIFDAQDHKHSIKLLQEPDLRMWVERLDQVVDSGFYHVQLRRRAVRSLRWTCGSRRVLPKSHYFCGRLFKASNRPMRGGATDVWKVADDRGEIFVAKVFPACIGEDHKIKRYYKELTVWKRLNHPNVVPILGASPDIAELCMVSPWMQEDLLQHLNKYPGANRVAIMIGVAEGLSYLHANDVVHGDLRGMNILFGNAGIPQICDFSLITFYSPVPKNDLAPESCGLRWVAPEILGGSNDKSGHPTRMSDIYAFGMVVVEIFTGKIPFPDLTDLTVYLAVMKGKRPPKPVDASKLGLSSGVWKLVEECWKKKREKRPEIHHVVTRLRKLW